MNNCFTINSLVNRVPEGMHIFFSKEKNCFYLLDSDNIPSKYEKLNLIICPCIYYYQKKIWNKFYDSLDEEEYKLAKSYPYKRGFFDYLRETGLKCKYDSAEDEVVVESFNRWLKDNNINLDFNSIIIK